MPDEVADRIRRLIFDGRLRPGDRVPTEAIAEALGVSAQPVREAMKTLGRDGLLEIRPHRGAFVGPFDERFLREHFEFVGMVQASAAIGTMELGDAAVLDELAAIAASATGKVSAVEVHASVLDFLQVIADTGGSPAQRAVREALGRLIPHGYFAELPGAADCGRTGLSAMLAALRSGDPEQVREISIQTQRERCAVVVRDLRARGVLPQ